jgi:outer membrane protein TolC
MAARNEVLAVEVERDRADLARVQARNAAAVAEADLARLVGLPPGATIEPRDPVGAPPPSSLDVGALAAAALAARPELHALQARLDAAEANVRVQRAAALPQASLNAGYDYARPNARILPLSDAWNDTWSVGLSLSWNVFDGGRASAAAAQARAQAEALRGQLEDARRRVRLEVTQRALDLESARAALTVAERAHASALENVRVAGDRYREGVGSSTDLLDAETGLLRAGLDRTSAAAGAQAALAGLRRAVGR